jgi:hypothetical protein
MTSPAPPRPAVAATAATGSLAPMASGGKREEDDEWKAGAYRMASADPGTEESFDHRSDTGCCSDDRPRLRSRIGVKKNLIASGALVASGSALCLLVGPQA